MFGEDVYLPTFKSGDHIDPPFQKLYSVESAYPESHAFAHRARNSSLVMAFPTLSLLGHGELGGKTLTADG